MTLRTAVNWILVSASATALALTSVLTMLALTHSPVLALLAGAGSLVEVQVLYKNIKAGSEILFNTEKLSTLPTGVRAGLLAMAFAGLGMIPMFAHELLETLALIGFTLNPLLAVVCASLMSTGMVWLLGKSFHDAMHGEKLVKCAKKIGGEFTKPGIFNKLYYGLGAAVLLSLAVFAAMTTSFKWGRQAWEARHLLPLVARHSIQIAIYTLQYLFIGIGWFCFFAEHSLKTLSTLPRIPGLIHTAWQQTPGDWLYNPIYWISKFCQLSIHMITLTWHFISEGAIRGNTTTEVLLLAAIDGAADADHLPILKIKESKSKKSKPDEYDFTKIPTYVTYPLFLVAAAAQCKATRKGEVLAVTQQMWAGLQPGR